MRRSSAWSSRAGYEPRESFAAQSLQLFADDLAIPVKTLETYRWVASRWPAQHSRHEVPYYMHKTLASLRDDEERWERITKPPLDKRTQTHRCTDTAAKQAVDQKFADTTSVQHKVERIHDLARDEQVAAAVSTDLLRRPEVAFKAMTDTTARIWSTVRRSTRPGRLARRSGSAPRRCPGSSAAATSSSWSARARCSWPR